MSTPLKGRKFHLVGAGGAGMSGLALAAMEMGAEVSGSDRAESTYVTRLREAGIEISIGHRAENVPDGAEVVRSTAVPADNLEIEAARIRGLKLIHRSQLLAELAALRPLCITVAGSHGKTTTTAMIAHVLDALGEDPSYFLGGEVTIGARTTNAHMGSGDVVVVEADESDGSFVRYSPQIAVVTNIEFEHPETWSGLDELLAAFREHVSGASRVVVEAGQPRLEELGLGDRGVTFSIDDEGADYFATELISPADPGAGTGFLLDGLAVHLGVRGAHNVKNALAAIAALELAGIERGRVADALSGFGGVERRFQLIGTTEQGAVIYDDYAHHPTEVRAALETARAAAVGRLVVFFQPHLFSRTVAYRREFAEALSLADVVVVLDVHPARERAADFPGVSGWLTAADVADRAGGRDVHYASGLTEAAEVARSVLRPGDLCVAMGAGTITELPPLLVAGR